MNTTMHLTDEQRQLLQQGQAVRITEPETQTACVLIRSDAYEATASRPAGSAPYDHYGSCRR